MSEESLEEFVNGTLYDIAPSEMMYRMELIEALDNGSQGAELTEEHRALFRQQLVDEMEEWKARLFKD